MTEKELFNLLKTDIDYNNEIIDADKWLSKFLEKNKVLDNSKIINVYTDMIKEYISFIIYLEEAFDIIGRLKDNDLLHKLQNTYVRIHYQVALLNRVLQGELNQVIEFDNSPLSELVCDFIKNNRFKYLTRK